MRGIVATMKLSSLTFCIPAYRDETTIASVVADAKDIGRTIATSFEILVINDKSPDTTGEILKKLQKTIPELRVINHEKNKGYGGTIRELYEKAQSEWLFTVPGDNQIPVSQVKKMLAGTVNADMIVGERIDRHDPKARLRQSSIYNTLCRILFGVKIHDVNSVRLMKTSIMEKVHLSKTSAFVDAELIIRAKKAGFVIVNLPIEHAKREAGEESAGGGKWSTIYPTIKDMVGFWILDVGFWNLKSKINNQ